ncbi:hypothetical protein NM688_g6448 [Phlebia brevispora]|uniref:Uncharacterized protein n=1 Tax=Phlebia brevispora TaxID=194682 RepID=A0ACC1SFY2_9APHY|nr:hypothetical protein NM688_g6448 [Phlebia brevispora]
MTWYVIGIVLDVSRAADVLKGRPSFGFRKASKATSTSSLVRETDTCKTWFSALVSVLVKPKGKGKKREE